MVNSYKRYYFLRTLTFCSKPRDPCGTIESLCRVLPPASYRASFLLSSISFRYFLCLQGCSLCSSLPTHALSYFLSCYSLLTIICLLRYDSTSPLLFCFTCMCTSRIIWDNLILLFSRRCHDLHDVGYLDRSLRIRYMSLSAEPPPHITNERLAPAEAVAVHVSQSHFWFRGGIKCSSPTAAGRLTVYKSVFAPPMFACNSLHLAVPWTDIGKHGDNTTSHIFATSHSPLVGFHTSTIPFLFSSRFTFLASVSSF